MDRPVSGFVEMAWSAAEFSLHPCRRADRQQPSYTTHKRGEFNWSGKQSLSTGVGLKYRGGRGGGGTSLQLAWRVCGRAVSRGLGSGGVSRDCGRV